MQSFDFLKSEPIHGPARRPQTIDELDVRQSVLEDLALKTLYLAGSLSVHQLAEKTRLSFEVAKEIVLPPAHGAALPGHGHERPYSPDRHHLRGPLAGGRPARAESLYRPRAGLSGELCRADAEAERSQGGGACGRCQARLCASGHRTRAAAAIRNRAQLRQLDLSLRPSGNGKNHGGRDALQGDRRG